MEGMIPQYWTGCNCLHMSISNILDFKNLPSPRSVWKQCGIMYVKNEQSLGELVSGFMTFEEELSWIHGIEVLSFKFTDKERFFERIYLLVDQREPVVVFIDPYFLPSAPTYQQLHGNHTITIVGYEQDHFIYIDDSYNTKGTISTEKLVECAGKNSFNRYECFYLNTNQVTHPTVQDYFSVIRQNVLALDIKRSEKEGTYGGYSGIDKFSGDFKRLTDDRELNEEELMKIYSETVRCANQHYLFAQFLEQGLTVHPDLTKIHFTLLLVAQELKVSSNMFIKASIGNRKQIFQRVIKKLEKACQLEQELVLLMKNLIHISK